jgi:hypothetical protein
MLPGGSSFMSAAPSALAIYFRTQILPMLKLKAEMN